MCGFVGVCGCVWFLLGCVCVWLNVVVGGFVSLCVYVVEWCCVWFCVVVFGGM